MAASVEVKVGNKVYKSKSDAIRALAAEGKSCSEIAKTVNANYVHAYQIIKKMAAEKAIVEETKDPVIVEAKTAPTKVTKTPTPKKEVVEKVEAKKTTVGKVNTDKKPTAVQSTSKKKTLTEVVNASKKHAGFYGSTHGNTVQWDGKKAIDMDTNEEVAVSSVLFEMPVEIE